MSINPDVDLRDFRVLLKGKIKPIPRLSYTLGYMYDAGEESWRFRQTGLMFEIPELWGRLFVGRTMDYHAKLDQQIQGLSKDQLKQVISKYVQQERLVKIKAGDLEKPTEGKEGKPTETKSQS